VGSEGNRAATDFFEETISFFEFITESTSFDCMDWEEQGASLMVDGKKFEIHASPYSLGCDVKAPLVVLSSVEELAAVNASENIFILRGELTKEQLMPKNFPFYNPEQHQCIIQLLESKNPQAIITATSRDLEMVGGSYPFPMIEDGDFNIPSVYMTDEDGDKLAEYAGVPVELKSRATRISSTGSNVIARKGERHDQRIVFVAHIDARMGSPGASDNASGVIVLLLLAELLEEYSGELGVEIVAMNGEDYYSNPGEQQYITLNKDRFNEIILGINIDDVGYSKGLTAYSLYDTPENITDISNSVFSKYDEFVEGEAWYAGDHGIFLLNQAPALAITSNEMAELMREITHTPNDKPDILDRTKLVEIAYALRDLVYEFEEHLRA